MGLPNAIGMAPANVGDRTVESNSGGRVFGWRTNEASANALGVTGGCWRFATSGRVVAPHHQILPVASSSNSP